MTTIALIGSGLIGRGWAMLFAAAGHDVRVYDANPEAETPARLAIKENLAALAEEGMIDKADALLGRIRFFSTMAEAVEGAWYVQESVLEDVALKAQVFEDLGRVAAPDAILASSCSSIPPERFMAKVGNRERCLIAHPFSPPHLIPLVEIVATRWTDPDVTRRTVALLEAIGQRPVHIHKPIVGFAVNRLQAVVIAEGLSMVADGVIDPEDLDLCMSQGLGLRWAFIGPFETMELNAAKGFKEYVTKYGDTYRAMLAGIRVDKSWSAEAVDKIERWRRDLYAEESDVTSRRLWRDRNLMKLAKLFRGPKFGAAQ